MLVSCCPVDSLNCTKEDLTVSVAIDGLEQEVRLSAEHDMDEAKVGFGEIQLFFASLRHLQVGGSFDNNPTRPSDVAPGLMRKTTLFLWPITSSRWHRLRVRYGW